MYLVYLGALKVDNRLSPDVLFSSVVLNSFVGAVHVFLQVDVRVEQCFEEGVHPHFETVDFSDELVEDVFHNLSDDPIRVAVDTFVDVRQVLLHQFSLRHRPVDEELQNIVQVFAFFFDQFYPRRRQRAARYLR